MGDIVKTDIANMALGHLQVSYVIGDFDERSQEAAAIRRFYDIVRRHVLRDFAWPFATVFVTLPLVQQNPTPEWKYSYRYPSNSLMFRRILSGLRNDNRQSRVPYRLGADDQGQLIYCSRTNAMAEYTKDVTDTQFFQTDFAEALSFLLASRIAPALTAGDPYKLGQAALQMYFNAIRNASANAANEEQPDLPVEAEWIRARGWGGTYNECFGADGASDIPIGDNPIL